MLVVSWEAAIFFFLGVKNKNKNKNKNTVKTNTNKVVLQFIQNIESVKNQINKKYSLFQKSLWIRACTPLLSRNKMITVLSRTAISQQKQNDSVLSKITIPQQFIVSNFM